MPITHTCMLLLNLPYISASLSVVKYTIHGISWDGIPSCISRIHCSPLPKKGISKTNLAIQGSINSCWPEVKVPWPRVDTDFRFGGGWGSTAIPKSVGFLQKTVIIVLDQVFFLKDFVHEYCKPFSHVLEVSLPLESRKSYQILQQVESGQTKNTVTQCGKSLGCWILFLMEEVSCTETIDRVECTWGPWISPKKGLNHMTFFDLQTCAKCFTQKVGYEIGYNSSFMQQLPGKKTNPGVSLLGLFVQCNQIFGLQGMAKIIDAIQQVISFLTVG